MGDVLQSLKQLSVVLVGSETQQVQSVHSQTVLAAVLSISTSNICPSCFEVKKAVQYNMMNCHYVCIHCEEQSPQKVVMCHI